MVEELSALIGTESCPGVFCGPHGGNQCAVGQQQHNEHHLADGWRPHRHLRSPDGASFGGKKLRLSGLHWFYVVVMHRAKEF
jgi:hypothetical protein